MTYRRSRQSLSERTGPMNIRRTAMSVDRRKFLRRTLQATVATQLGWAAAACTGRQSDGPGGGVPPGGNGKQGFRSTEWLGDVTLSPGQLRAMQAGPYILHARAGTLSRVPAEKSPSAPRPPGPRADGRTGHGPRPNHLRQPEYSDVPLPGMADEVGTSSPARKKWSAPFKF